jgi:putative MATE family efflux protein
MRSKEKKCYLMENEKVGTALLKLGIPTMIGMMISAFYNLVDTFFVGKLGTSQIAAVSVSFPISIVLLSIGLLFGSGASSYLARLLGNRKNKEADVCFSTSLITSVIVGVVLVIIMLICLTPMLSALGASQTMMPYAKQYAIPFIIGLMFNVFNITVNNMITAEGATSYSMIAMLAGGVANMILDPILILELNMGVTGAAVATLISRLISFGMYVYYIGSGKSSFHFNINNVKPEKKLYIEVVKIGFPMMILQLFTFMALSITNFKAKAYGDSAVAGIGIANRILSLGSMMLTGFFKGYQPFVGYNFGAKNYDRARNATKIMLWGSTFFCVAVGLLLIIERNNLMAVFDKVDPEVMRVGGLVLILNSITFMGTGYAMVYIFLFLALGKAKQGGVISICRQGLFFLPLIFILPAIFGLNGIIFAQPVADCLTVFIVIALSFHKQYIPHEAESVIQS